jgi:hypothetical protein
MSYTNDIYGWMLNSLFILGILLIPVGLGFMLVPEKIFRIANKMNRWVSTESFFKKINSPIYKERFFYRHNKLLGAGIFFISVFCLYVLTISIGIEDVSNILIKLAETAFEKWLFVILFYVLLAAIFLALIFGTIMFVRPSALKSFESWGNRWIDTDEPLKVMDKSKNLPDRILPGNPRIFGFAVTIAGVYIVWSTYTAL